MPTQNVNLPEQLSEFVRQKVASGRYNNASEVVRAGLRLLEQREAEDELKLKRLRTAVRAGFDQIDQGEFERVTPDTIDDFVERLKSGVDRSP